ncbi:hypothetical protein JCM10449v2_004916 [Rhodotorula kratochvilovae]
MDDGGNSDGGLPLFPRRNIFGNPLLPAPVGSGPQTGFFRNNYCDASPADPASHTVAAVVTPAFLDFSKSRGNDLWPLFPSLRSPSSSSSSPREPCVWCLCASRWLEALRASASHPRGEDIVPRVVLEATHERAPADGGFDRGVLERFAVGGDGTGRIPPDPAGGTQGGGAQGAAGAKGGERIGR